MARSKGTIGDGEVTPSNFETVNRITAFIEAKRKQRRVDSTPVTTRYSTDYVVDQSTCYQVHNRLESRQDAIPACAPDVATQSLRAGKCDRVKGLRISWRA